MASARVCRVCRRAEGAPLFEKHGYEVLACPSCGSAFVAKPPSAGELASHYSLDYFKGNRDKFGYVDYAAEEGLTAGALARKARRLRETARGGRVLDVGCATGAFLKQLGEGWEKHGVELSRELLEAHPPGPDVEVFRGDFLDYPEERGPFDVVTLWDVLDHVLDPEATLRKAARLLKPGGTLALNVGDRESAFARLLGRRWHLYIPPTHLTYFSRRGLLGLLERCGLAPVSWEYEGKWVPLSLCLFRLSYVLTHDFFRKLYERSLRSRLGGWSVYINLRDVVTVYASKAA